MLVFFSIVFHRMHMHAKYLYEVCSQIFHENFDDSSPVNTCTRASSPEYRRMRLVVPPPAPRPRDRFHAFFGRGRVSYVETGTVDAARTRRRRARWGGAPCASFSVARAQYHPSGCSVLLRSLFSSQNVLRASTRCLEGLVWGGALVTTSRVQ